MKKTVLTSTILTSALGLMGAIPIGQIPVAPNITSMSNTNHTTSAYSTLNYSATATGREYKKSVCTQLSGSVTISHYSQWNLSGTIERIFYNDDTQLYTEFVRRMFGFTGVKTVRIVSYNANTNTLMFDVNGEFEYTCEYKHPVYPDRGYHTHEKQWFSLNGNNLQDSQTNVNVQVQLNQSIFNIGTKITDLFSKPASFLYIDKKATLQGFKHNYLSLKLHSEYLKGVILTSVNLNAAMNIINDPMYASINTSEDFIKVIEYLKQGKLFDANHHLTNKLIFDTELNESYKNVRYWLDKILSNEDIADLNDESKWLSNYKSIEQNEIIATNDQIYYMYDELLLSNPNLVLDIEWSSGENNGNTEVAFSYNENSKLFIPRNNAIDDESFKITTNKINNTQNSVSINQIALSDVDHNYKYVLDHVNMHSENNEHINLKAGSYEYIYNFNISELINVKQNLSDEYWQTIFKPHVMDPNTWIENPESWIKKFEFKQIITDFSTADSPIAIKDLSLDTYLRTDKNLSITTNGPIENLISNYDITTYNSVNGVEISLNYFNYDSMGIKQSDDLINQVVRYSFTPEQAGESTHTKIIQNEIMVSKILTNNPEQYVMDEFIGYEGDENNKLITTELSKTDWITNAFSNIEIIEHNENSIKGIIHYNEESSVTNFLNYNSPLNSASLRFEIYTRDNSASSSNGNKNSSNESINDTLHDKSSTQLWIGISCITGAILIFLIAWYCFNKYKRNTDRQIRNSIEKTNDENNSESKNTKICDRNNEEELND